MKRLLFYISLILIIFIVVVVNLSTTNFRGEIGVQEQEYYADGQTPESRQYDGNHKLTEIRTYTRAEGEFNLPPEGMTIVNNNVYFALVKHTKNPDVYVSSLVSWPLSNPSANFTTRIQPTENLWHANDFTYNPDKRILLGATAKKEIGLYAATLDTQGRIYRFTNYPNSNSKVFTYSGVAYNYDKGNYIGYREGKFYSFDVELDDDNFPVPKNEKLMFSIKTTKENGDPLATQGIAYRYNHVYMSFSDKNIENNEGNIGKNYIRKYKITDEATGAEQLHEGRQYSLFPKATNNSTLSTATQESDYLNELEGIEFTSDGKMVLIYNLHEIDSDGQTSLKIGFYEMDRDFEQDIIDDDNTEPTISSVTGNSTSWTNGNVTLKVNAKDYESGIAAYSFDGGSSWQSSNQKTFSANSTVNIQVKDKAGNINFVTVVIDKIDKTKPSITSISGNPTSWTNGNVTLTVNAADSQSGIKEYSFDGGSSWQTSKQKIFGANSTVNIKVKDNVGNISTTSSITINKIDKTKPVIRNVTGVPNSTTRENVILTVDAVDNESGVASYSFDGGTTWQASNRKTYSENTSNIVIKVKDSVGNIETYGTTINITQIDRTDPNQGQENNNNTNQNLDPNQGQENNGNTNQNPDTNQGQENNTNQNQNQNQNQEPATNNSIPTQTNNSQNNNYNYNMNTKENIQTTEQTRIPQTNEKTKQNTKESSEKSVVDKTTSSAEKLPQTGDNSIIVGCIVILSMISAFGIYKVRKNKYE